MGIEYMSRTQNNILTDHQVVIADIFDHIKYLIDGDQLDRAREELLNLHYADLADFIDNLNHNLYSKVLSLIQKDIDPQALVFINDANKQFVLKTLGSKRCAELFNDMDIEDVIEVVEHIFDTDLKDDILLQLSEERRQQVLEGFTYPENTIGRIVERKYISFQEHWTVGQAIDYLRRNKMSQGFYAAIIVNTKNKPVGTILLSTLLSADRQEHLSKLMNSDYTVANAHEQVDDLAYIFKKYALTLVPVINRAGKLVGTVSIDNMLYIIEEQTESEFMQLGGIKESDIFNSSFKTARLRCPWLFFNMMTSFASSMIINSFSDTIAKLVTLATIMPIVAAMGGNVAMQTVTVTVRALASRDINNANVGKVVINEILACSFNGIVLAVIAGSVSYILFHDTSLSLIFMSAIIIDFVIAGLFGVGVPITMNNFGFDPANSSGVFVTGTTDAVAFFSFLGLAYLFLI